MLEEPCTDEGEWSPSRLVWAFLGMRFIGSSDLAYTRFWSRCRRRCLLVFFTFLGGEKGGGRGV